jgi:hypothetical protein
MDEVIDTASIEIDAAIIDTRVCSSVPYLEDSECCIVSDQRLMNCVRLESLEVSRTVEYDVFIVCRTITDGSFADQLLDSLRQE